jgi:capsular exopolysaccharide synthesis family protein
MSRIHEALNKAVQDRSAQGAAGLEADAAEVAVEIQRSVAVEPGAARLAGQPRVTVDASQIGPVRYEELVRRCAHPNWRLDRLTSVFQNPTQGRGGSERFLTLRSRLSQIAGTRTLRRLLVTSSVAAEGKTFVVSNLGQSIVRQPERRVLLIDADLRCSSLHTRFDAPSRPGLTEYLRGEADEYAVIQKGMAENLCLLPCGSGVSNPSELLLSGKMKRLLDLVTPMFDWIIIDSPPALPVHDASILADLTDGVLLVLRAGSTDVEVAEKVAAEFQRKNLLGVVLNQVEKSDSYGAYYDSYSAEAV